jgi:hypothetical protein
MTEVIASISGISPIAISASGIAISGIAQLQIPSQEQSISIAAFNQATDNSLANLQNRNVLIQSEGIVPNDELVHMPILSKHISKKKVEELAIQRYGTCGRGISFSDVIMEFRCSKDKAQRILKDCCHQRMGKDGTKHAPSLFGSPKRTSPQRYYPSARRADIFERLKQRDNVPIDPPRG